MNRVSTIDKGGEGEHPFHIFRSPLWISFHIFTYSGLFISSGLFIHSYIQVFSYIQFFLWFACHPTIDAEHDDRGGEAEHCSCSNMWRMWCEFYVVCTVWVWCGVYSVDSMWCVRCGFDLACTVSFDLACTVWFTSVTNRRGEEQFIPLRLQCFIHCWIFFFFPRLHFFYTSPCVCMWLLHSVYYVDSVSFHTRRGGSLYSSIRQSVRMSAMWLLYEFYPVVRVHYGESVYVDRRSGGTLYSSIRLYVCMSAMWFLYDIYPVLRDYYVHSVYLHTRPRMRYTHSLRLRSAQHVVKSLGISRRYKSLCTNSTSDSISRQSTLRVLFRADLPSDRVD